MGFRANLSDSPLPAQGRRSGRGAAGDSGELIPVFLIVLPLRYARPPPLEPTERQNHRFEMRLVFAIDIERKPPFLHPQRNAIRTCVAVLMLALWREIIAFENVENGNTPLLLDIGIRQMIVR